MRFLRDHSIGLVAGFLFGTVGIFALALLSLMHPLLEAVSAPFLLPGRAVAGFVAGPSASSWTVTGLYLLTGLFYAAVGALVQFAVRAVRPPRA